METKEYFEKVMQETGMLTRMKDGDKDYLSMLPCYYKAPEKQVKECA